MKLTTKIICGVSALLMLLTCGGCGSKKDTASDTKTNSNYTAEAGKLIMATNATFPPYEYKEGETIVGIDAEVAKLIADKLGLELELQTLNLTPSFPVFRPASMIWVWQV